MIESPQPKSGVLFVRTHSGGTLMDLSGDRFISLSPVSAAIWSGLAANQRAHDLIGNIMQARSVSATEAEALLREQFARWKKADLINPSPEPPVQLPRAKMAPATPPGEIHADQLARQRVRPVVVAKLFATELGYRRALTKHGLGATLSVLQRERGKPAMAPEAILLSTLGSYYAMRRAFRQGQTAHDCLFRSLALAAVLRRQGVQADLCIGIIDLPFSAHAWVEGHGLVLNETLRKRQEYTVIGRF